MASNVENHRLSFSLKETMRSRSPEPSTADPLLIAMESVVTDIGSNAHDALSEMAISNPISQPLPVRASMDQLLSVVITYSESDTIEAPSDEVRGGERVTLLCVDVIGIRREVRSDKVTDAMCHVNI